MTKLLSLGKTQYLGNVIDLRFAGGIIFSAVSAESAEKGFDALHFHENPIISFILEGNSFERINRETNHRSAGDIRFYRAGDWHQVKIERFPSRNINFELESDFLIQNELSEEQINCSIRKNPHAKHLCLRMYKEFSANDEFSISSVHILLFNLLAESEINADNKKPQWINALYELLNDRWNEQMSLQELGFAVNVHPITISKYFTRYFSCTYGEYMRRLRINKSIHLIKNSPLSLTEIAQQCGFFDQSHFTRNFKELTGFLPKDFKKF